MDDYGFAVRVDFDVTPAKYGHITFATVCLAPLARARISMTRGECRKSTPSVNNILIA
jgi:hypothetical protein